MLVYGRLGLTGVLLRASVAQLGHTDKHTLHHNIYIAIIIDKCADGKTIGRKVHKMILVNQDVVSSWVLIFVSDWLLQRFS